MGMQRFSHHPMKVGRHERRIKEDKIINQISAITEKIKDIPTVVFI